MDHVASGFSRKISRPLGSSLTLLVNHEIPQTLGVTGVTTLHYKDNTEGRLRYSSTTGTAS